VRDGEMLGGHGKGRRIWGLHTRIKCEEVGPGFYNDLLLSLDVDNLDLDAKTLVGGEHVKRKHRKIEMNAER
jgi:hypothetical protein